MTTNDDTHCLFFNAQGDGPSTVRLIKREVRKEFEGGQVVVPRAFGLCWEVVGPLRFVEDGGFMLTADTATWLRDALTAWLDAPRLAARANPEIVARDGDDVLVRTAFEWGVGTIDEPGHSDDAPVGLRATVEAVWFPIDSRINPADVERDARRLYAEERGKVLCECGAEVDSDDAVTDSDDGLDLCPACAAGLREEWLAGQVCCSSCMHTDIGRAFACAPESDRCPKCGGEILELVGHDADDGSEQRTALRAEVEALQREVARLTEAQRLADERERAHIETRTALHSDVARLEAELAAAPEGCYYTDPARKPDPCDCPGCRVVGHGGRPMPRRFNLVAFFDERGRWSLATFGPGDRYAGVVAHIRKELVEIEADPRDLVEWCDVVLLAMDGAMRAAGADGAAFLAALIGKQAKNVARRWPDWRSLAPGEVSEHIREPVAVEPRSCNMHGDCDAAEARAFRAEAALAAKDARIEEVEGANVLNRSALRLVRDELAAKDEQIAALEQAMLDRLDAVTRERTRWIGAYGHGQAEIDAIRNGFGLLRIWYRPRHPDGIPPGVYDEQSFAAAKALAAAKKEP